MKLTNLLLALLVVTFATTPLLAQDKNQADVLYDEGVTLYGQNQLTEAVAKFEETLTINPKHKNALFNLGVINLENGNRAKGLEYLQTCVKLGDRDAASMLRDKLNVQIAYADTMHFEDIETGPKMMVKGMPEDIFVPGDVNNSFKYELTKCMKSSKLLEKDAGKGKLYVLQLYITKEGVIDAAVINNDSKMVQREVSRLLRAIPDIIAAKHAGKAVTMMGFTIPVRISNYR
ncbi:tetratricopeptide repeat protein [Pontibacter sp. BT310]|uniref:Tetratricopeptide repeat protein n=1 Tax=Pontibacter populi TaxID=890055 RepID=A0ABS6X715_9BACT|nr:MULTISPECIES: tetratricopeptide repeat protein [Pontibacter]MBJ6116824.1 tetratricopeptide repeat protein [Pontibacter sp. BT310]MBR0569246.1 tetratricopeptide repeat protein [Microvirga sp. STS03]MBW3363677.1 tetratricopeptide repeat protein [Pontibacter populi]